MIKRDYFMYGQKSYKDGSVGYSWEYIHLTNKSWFSDSLSAFNECKLSLLKAMEDKPGDEVQIISFSRC